MLPRSQLNVPGGELAINSDGFFDLEKQPKKVAVIGAGYIAVELAGIFHGLGSEAHLFFRGATVLRHGFVRRLFCWTAILETQHCCCTNFWVSCLLRFQPPA
jgi:hypothetical protein